MGEIGDRLQGFPVVNYISLKESKERQHYMQTQLDRLGLTGNLTLCDKSDEDQYHFTGNMIHLTGPRDRGVSAAHLLSIKKWYESAQEDIGLFCEDDSCFETAYHWGFTWLDFIAALPKDFNCVQLMRINHWTSGVNDDDKAIQFRPRRWYDWGVFHILTRDYAKNLIDTYIVDGCSFNLEIPFDRSIIPCPENVLYFSTKLVHNVPLFVESNDFPTTFVDMYEKSPCTSYDAQNKQKANHYLANNHFIEKWAEQSPVSLDRIMGTQ